MTHTIASNPTGNTQLLKLEHWELLKLDKCPRHTWRMAHPETMALRHDAWRIVHRARRKNQLVLLQWRCEIDAAVGNIQQDNWRTVAKFCTREEAEAMLAKIRILTQV